MRRRESSKYCYISKRRDRISLVRIQPWDALVLNNSAAELSCKLSCTQHCRYSHKSEVVTI